MSTTLLTDAGPAAQPLLGMSQDSDIQLAERIRGGDVAAFESVFASYYAPLLTYLTYQLGAQDVAEDSSRYRGTDQCEQCNAL